MKTLGKLLTMGLCSLGLVVLLSSNAFAIKAQAEDPHAGEPPYGVAVKTDAKGTKLTGVLCVEYYDIQIDGTAKANVVLRLRQGNELYSFYKSVGIADISDIPGTQGQIMVEMAFSEEFEDGGHPAEYIGVLETFFGNEDHTFTVKSLEEYDKVPTCLAIDGSCGDNDRHYFLMDVVVAVQ